MNDKSKNAGVHAGTGFEFQKHCALYILLENWESYKDRKYFICIEHHDDFLFCHLTEDNLIEKTKAYQAKKSSEKWSLSKDFYLILQKILEVGKNLNDDKSMGKTTNYVHKLSFISNNTINLKSDKQNIIVNETNTLQKYIDLDSKLQDKIKDEIKKIYSDLSEINNLIFSYIDFGKTVKSQINQLVGMFEDVFKDKVTDHKAAVDTLLSLFREIELTFNQENSAKLLDESKRLESEKINYAINIITTRKKAFEYWRTKKSELARILVVPKSQQKQFELHFENSFDYFKDLKQAEHQKIFNFVKTKKYLFNNCFDDTECINLLYKEAVKSEILRQDELHLKAALFAAFIEVEGV